ncbi:MAG TPA: delta-60 repeat domain-containing protein, partial [Polyangiaceae bacterium]|nr:delta-60 repeat domain-containing protein [Polyangiaceae bacterium]
SYSGVQRPVLFKLGPDGQGPRWVFSEPVGTAAEAYGAALQSNGKFVTAGYGRPNAAATTSDFVSIRLNATGTLDTSYGVSGARWLDVGGFGDNARTVVVLGDDRVLLAGGGRLTADDTDGAVAILTASGAPDATFSPAGCKTYDFGTPGDFLWAGALSPDKKFVALVGITGVSSSSMLDNDSTFLLLPVE